MDLNNYGIGGNEVKIDASEGIADIPQNRTLLVEQLTKDEPISPEVIEGLTSIEDVFGYFKPEVDIEFENAEGQPVEETFRFSNVGDFGVKNMTARSPFLSGLNTEKEFADRMEKGLRSNKLLQRTLENPEARQAFVNALHIVREQLIKEGGMSNSTINE